MRQGFRRTVAVSEIVGGVLMLAGVAMAMAGGVSLKWWYWLLLVGLGAASVAAGGWLWRGDPRGIRWSRPLLALQVLQVKTTTWGVGLFLGLHVSLTAGKAGWYTSLGVAGRLDLLVGVGAPWELSVNLFALAAFISSMRSPDAHPLPDHAVDADLPPDPPPAAHPEPAA